MPGYQTRQASVAIRGADDLIIRSLLDRQQFADPLGEAAAVGISSATWSLFGQVWPSGLQLAAHMSSRPIRSGERILEVGCGLALASLVCHRMGVDVTASDAHPLAAEFLRENARLNGLSPVTYRHGDWSTDHRATAPSARCEVEGLFDVIIGSDVLYERDETGLLAHFIKRHAQTTCEVWIVDPDRGNRPGFSRRLLAQGFALTESRLEGGAAEGDRYKGRLLHYSRNPISPDPTPPGVSPR